MKGQRARNNDGWVVLKYTHFYHPVVFDEGAKSKE
jgi:hypothetical protein